MKKSHYKKILDIQIQLDELKKEFSSENKWELDLEKGLKNYKTGDDETRDLALDFILKADLYNIEIEYKSNELGIFTAKFRRK